MKQWVQPLVKPNAIGYFLVFFPCHCFLMPSRSNLPVIMIPAICPPLELCLKAFKRICLCFKVTESTVSLKLMSFVWMVLLSYVNWSENDFHSWTDLADTCISKLPSKIKGLRRSTFKVTIKPACILQLWISHCER